MATESTRDVLPVEREVYILTNLYGTHRGVYRSKTELIAGIDSSIEKNPEQSLIYELWYAPGEEEITWEFAYISESEHDEALDLAKESCLDDEAFPTVTDVNLLTYKKEDTQS